MNHLDKKYSMESGSTFIFKSVYTKMTFDGDKKMKISNTIINK